MRNESMFLTAWQVWDNPNQIRCVGRSDTYMKGEWVFNLEIATEYQKERIR